MKNDVLLYAADADSEFREPCRRWIEDARRDPSPAFLTWNICYEFLRVSTRICTRDTGFHRFPFLTVVDPVRPGAKGRRRGPAGE